MHEVHRADLAQGNHLARLLHQRIAAIIERDRMHDTGLGGGIDEAPGLGCGHRERLVRDHVLAMRERRHDHRHVQIVGGGVVDDVHVGIGDQRFVVTICFRHAERFGLAARRGVAARCDRHDVDEPETADGVDVVRANEAGADQAHANASHAIAPPG